MEYFYGMIRWAGGDLRRWEKARRMFGKNPLLRAMYRQETRTAHAAFIELRRQAGTGGDNWRAMLEQCLSSPFLHRELALFMEEQKTLSGSEQSAEPQDLLPGLSSSVTTFGKM